MKNKVNLIIGNMKIKVVNNRDMLKKVNNKKVGSNKIEEGEDKDKDVEAIIEQMKATAKVVNHNNNINKEGDRIVGEEAAVPEVEGLAVNILRDKDTESTGRTIKENREI